MQTKTEFNGKVPSREKDMKSKLLYFKSDVLDIDSFKNRWIDKNSEKKNFPKGRIHSKKKKKVVNFHNFGPDPPP